MKKISCAVILLLAFIHAFSQEKKVKSFADEYGIQGLQLVYVKGNKTQAYNIGTVNKGSDKKVSSNTIFEAASLSKCVFAYTVMRLYDRGVISLDTPLLHYTGSYERFDPKDARYAKITARMVLRHTTGLPNWGDDKGARLLFTPDSCFSYSGEGYVFLQKAVEKLTHKSLNDLAQEEVFTPFKMTSSSYVWENKFDTLAAFGNSPEAINRHKNANAAYSLLTTAHDYALFLQALLAGHGLKPATRQLMFEKSSSGTRFGQPVIEANQHIDWGLGVGLQQNELGKAIWHWGDNGNFKGFFIAFPDRQEILVYFTHNPYGLNITADILNTFFGKQTWWPTQWNDYGFKSPKAMKNLRAKLVKHGYSHAMEIVAKEKKKDPTYQLPEDDLNSLGYMLMSDNKKKDAAEVFKLNTNLYPNSANTYDSLAEAYEALDERELAIKNYKRSLELNPQNNNAAEHIKKLELLPL
ncbi:CubicO group peptidase, beta-lactamase class C family [Mucilaginibacter lappiensis]|uniref:CubicO group peptidase (Beta-lactamase class C family) n=1 Tax=Mucilaginibacter lappiensis TaxID=354630 RepID=A0ABR6PKC9_9SPHI|nr:serine hydrolase [Mucilaginibacter lappiensis]MBB6110227.1 CubicO group peptidase (beta-lactamase class C family) [Mucilaginibacter lappiensis]SIR26925.1 CubicO group peptidase, beta-lactamase class C family [Mucilaginibacter lappiensis]